MAHEQPAKETKIRVDIRPHEARLLDLWREIEEASTNAQLSSQEFESLLATLLEPSLTNTIDRETYATAPVPGLDVSSPPFNEPYNLLGEFGSSPYPMSSPPTLKDYPATPFEPSLMHMMDQTPSVILWGPEETLESQFEESCRSRTVYVRSDHR